MKGLEAREEGTDPGRERFQGVLTSTLVDEESTALLEGGIPFKL